MSEWAKNDTGSKEPHIIRYQTDATVANVGVPLLIDTAGQAGLNAGTTTSAADFVGMATDTGQHYNVSAAYGTTQGSGGSMPNSAEYKVGVIRNSDAIYRCLLSGGAAEGTALTLYDVTTASTTGLDVVTGDDFTNFDEGVIWGFDGANVSQIRKITVGDATDASVLIPFDNDTVVGDNFMVAPYWFNATTAVQLTTNLYQADASIAVATGAEFKVVDMDLYDQSRDGRTKSAIYMMANDHNAGGRPT